MARAHAEPPAVFNTLFPSGNSLDGQLRALPASFGGDPSLLDNRLRGGLVVSKSATDTWFLQQTVGSLDLSRSLVIPQTGVAVPRRLWDIETGGSFRRVVSDRKDWGIFASIGSASDEPFHSIRETTLRMTAAYRLPSLDRNSWLLLLSYSNNRNFANNIPLPGVAYVVNAPKKGIEAAIGFPFLSITHKPSPRWTNRTVLIGPRNFSAETAFRVKAPVETYVGFDAGEKSWLRADRVHRRDRLFLGQKRWNFGLRFPLARGLRADIGAGYDYNRRFYEYKKAKSHGVPAADLRSAWTFQTKLGFKW